MKILIVDDKDLTRTGLVSSIDWNSLGIDEVFQADDGVKGLEIARLYRPEIILCDVRMPRMSGIAMLEEVEKILPDTVPIFMSGYSDKEYLKAAIKLKTVNYIEKPLDPEEIREAVLTAAELYEQKQHTHQGEAVHSMQTISRLALALTSPMGSNQDEIRELSPQLHLQFSAKTGFAALVFHLQSVPENAQSVFYDIYVNLNKHMEERQLHCLYTEKRPQHFVYFLLGDPSSLSDELEGASRFLSELFARLGKYLAAAGEVAVGTGGSYQSYSSAVILLQSSFFFPAYTLLTPELFDLTASAAEEPKDFSAENEFPKVLSRADSNACDQFLDDLFHIYQNSHTLMPNQIRDLYYKLFLILDESRRQHHLVEVEKSENIMDEIENAFTYAWIDAMKNIMENDDKYADLELVEVAYGDDEPQKSTDQTEALITNYPDLKVICAPTTVGIDAAAKYLQDNGCACKLTGLGLPSEMIEYTGDGDDYSCTYFYLWDMQGLGDLSAYATIALVDGDITGAVGETFTAGDLGDFEITDADDGGTEVVLGPPMEFNPENIEEMAELY